MAKSAIFITDDNNDNNEKITHMFTAEHGFVPGNITVHDQIHKLDFTTKPDEPSFFAFNIADNCDTNIVDVESCIGKEYASPYDTKYKGKKAYYFVSGENSGKGASSPFTTNSEGDLRSPEEFAPPVQYILADIENNVIKMENNGGITIFIRPSYIQSDQPYADVLRRDRGQNQPNPGTYIQSNQPYVDVLRRDRGLNHPYPGDLSQPVITDDGSSINTLSAPVHPNSSGDKVASRVSSEEAFSPLPGSISTPVAIQIDEPHEIQTALAEAIQIAEPIQNM
jgi:hypothetical protein